MSPIVRLDLDRISDPINAHKPRKRKGKPNNQCTADLLKVSFKVFSVKVRVTPRADVFCVKSLSTHFFAKSPNYWRLSYLMVAKRLKENDTCSSER